jgi:hypothetical protein
MLAGTVLLANVIRKCFQQQYHAASKATTPALVVKEQPEQRQTPEEAMALDAEQPASMEVDGLDTAIGAEEWTQEEMHFMRAALEQVRRRRSCPPAKAGGAAPAMCLVALLGPSLRHQGPIWRQGLPWCSMHRTASSTAQAAHWVRVAT